MYTPLVYVAQKTLDLGADKESASMILLVFGIFNSVSRVTTGLLADRPFVDVIMFHNVAGILMGLLTLLVPALNSYGLLMGYSAFYGVVLGAYFLYRLT